MNAIEMRDLRIRAQSQRDSYLADLETLVNIDSGTFDITGVNAVAQVLAGHYKSLGADVRMESGATSGNNLVASFSGSGPGSVLLIGHTDTVFPQGTVLKRPFRVADGRAYGPGVADMKSGDLNIVYALNALRQMEWNDFGRIEVVHNSDEEIGSPGSRELIRTLAATSDAVLVLEPGRANGDIVSGRKGIADCRVTVRGVASHAGVNHDSGRSAILELAHIVTHLEALNGTVEGASLNVGHIHGGERINVVPDEAFAHFEIRAFDVNQLDAMIAGARKAVASRTVPETDASIDVTIEHTPMHKSAESDRLVRLASTLAESLGFTVRDVATGGASDGNTAAAAGKPVLDGLGPVGGGAHSSGEYIEIESIAPRIALLAGLIASVGSGAWRRS